MAEQISEIIAGLTSSQHETLWFWSNPVSLKRDLQGQERYVRFVNKNVGKALAKKGLAEGPYHDYPSGWKVVLTDLGVEVARALPRPEGV